MGIMENLLAHQRLETPVLQPLTIAYGEKPMQLPLSTLQATVQTQTKLLDALEAACYWLNSQLPVDMVAYCHPRSGTFHMACEGRSHLEPQLATTVRDIMEGPTPRMRHWRVGNHFYHIHTGTPMPHNSRFLLVEPGGKISVESANALLQAMAHILSHKI
uniref:Uncharacterized protein n=1 Tax=Magnetococcus massalia (strain MO-1) TaxID=451514 RepID=A0A1S7LGM8_MAGMO|nr:Conserved protein of unknown function [Candidatus Magnetococcus massalia]